MDFSSADQATTTLSHLSVQELRTQIAMMAKELTGYKDWTDPLSNAVWAELVCCPVAIPKREVALPNADELENMNHGQLSEVLGKLAEKLREEVRYWKAWRWAVNDKGCREAAVKWWASAIRKHSHVVTPVHDCLDDS